MKRIVTFITSSSNNISFNVEDFCGATPVGGSTATLYFKKLDGQAGRSTVVVNYNFSAAGFGFKKFCQALVSAFGSQPYRSNIMIANDDSGVIIRPGFAKTELAGIVSIGNITE